MSLRIGQKVTFIFDPSEVLIVVALESQKQPTRITNTELAYVVKLNDPCSSSQYLVHPDILQDYVGQD